MPTKDNAVSALKTEIELNKAAITKLDEVITQKNFDGENTDRERYEKSEISLKLTHLENRLAQTRAASVVVSAPTEEEIIEVSEGIAKIRSMAVAEEFAAQGLNAIENILREASSKLSKRVNSSLPGDPTTPAPPPRG